MIPPKQSFSQRMQSIQQQPMQGSQQNGLQTGANGMPSQIQQSADQQQINQDAPMGDPIDTIAQMLGLDLSAAASPDQQGQMVASAVEALVLQLHQYVDQYGMLDGSQAPDDQLDDQQQNYEDDGNEGAEDGEGAEGQSPDTDNTMTDGEGVDESEDAGVGDGTQQGTQKQFPPKNKAIAASFFDQDFAQVPISARVLNGMRRGREMQLLQLAQEGYITPVMFKELKQEFCSTNALSLSLSQDDAAPDEFDTVCARFVKNGKLLELSAGIFGAQDGYRVLSQSKGEDGDDPQQSPLVKAAEARVAEIERKKKRIASQY